MQRNDFRLNRRNLFQFLEYMVGGTIYFWSGYLVFAICYSGLHWHWFAAKIVADIVGWTLNYLVQRYWVFNSKKLKNNEARIVGRYALITILNLGIDYLLIWGLQKIGITPYVGFFISAGFFTIWNYLWYRFWVFYTKRKPKTGNSHE